MALQQQHGHERAAVALLTVLVLARERWRTVQAVVRGHQDRGRIDQTKKVEMFSLNHAAKVARVVGLAGSCAC